MTSYGTEYIPAITLAAIERTFKKMAWSGPCFACSSRGEDLGGDVRTAGEFWRHMGETWWPSGEGKDHADGCAFAGAGEDGEEFGAFGHAAEAVRAGGDLVNEEAHAVVLDGEGDAVGRTPGGCRRRGPRRGTGRCQPPVVWDNLGSHKGPQMRKFADDHDWLTAFQLPSYAPELNPTEGVRANLKGQLYNLAVRGIDEIATIVKSDLKRVRYRRGLLDGMIAGTGLHLEPRNPSS